MTKIGILDLANNINEVRDMTVEELAEYNEMVERTTNKKLQEKAELDEAEAALLSSLGITKQQAIVLRLLQPDYVKPNFA